MNQKTKGILLAIICAAVFGLWPNCVRAVYAEGGNTAFVVLVTTFARMLPLVLFCRFTNKPIFETREDMKLGLRGGFFQAAAVLSAQASLVYLPGPVSITICFTQTLMLLFFLAWRGEAKLDAITIITTVIALVGLSFVLNLWSQTGHVSILGACLAFLSAVATMSRLYVFGQRTKTSNPAIVGAETFIFTMLFVLLVPLVQMPHLPATAAGWGWIALGSLTFSIGTFGMFYAIALIGSFRFSLFSKTEPVFTALFAALLIGETLHMGQYLGILLVVGSLAVYQYIDHKRKET